MADQLATLAELLTEARDLLMERRFGNPARSPAHNARLVIEEAISVEAALCALPAEPRSVAPARWLVERQLAHGGSICWSSHEHELDAEQHAEKARCEGRFSTVTVSPLYARPQLTREGLIELIMRETPDEIRSDGLPTGQRPNVLVQGCKFIRGHQPGYERPDEAAKAFAGLIADAILDESRDVG